MLNAKFRQAYAIAKAIPRRTTPESKRATIRKWCEVVKKALAA